MTIDDAVIAVADEVAGIVRRAGVACALDDATINTFVDEAIDEAYTVRADLIREYGADATIGRVMVAEVPPVVAH